MGILTIIGIIYIIFKVIEEATEPTCPKDKHVDYQAMSDDRILNHKSQKQLNKDYRKGKYFK